MQCKIVYNKIKLHFVERKPRRKGKADRKDAYFVFGYIKTYPPQLRVSDYEAYRSAYCGVCKRIGKDYGHFWRLFLSYDFAFLKVLYEALQKGKLCAKRRRCIAHPFHKRYCMGCSGDIQKDRLISAAAVLTMGAQIEDHAQDAGFFGRLFWKPLAFFTRLSLRKARRDFPELTNAAKSLGEAQKRAEQRDSVSADAAADPTGTYLAFVLESLSVDAVEKRVLHEMGYQLGRYVYFTDALDDLEKDARRRRFNPFLLRGVPQTEEDKTALRSAARQTINRCIGGVIDAYELLSLHRLKPVLDNILYFGLQNTLNTQNTVCQLHAERKRGSEEMEII